MVFLCGVLAVGCSDPVDAVDAPTDAGTGDTQGPSPTGERPDPTGGATEPESTGGTGGTDEPSTGGTTGGDDPACAPGPDGWGYAPIDEDGRLQIDALFVLTVEAFAEIDAMEGTPDDYLAFRIDEVNESLERSEIDGSRLRYVGYHPLVDADYTRTGFVPDGTSADVARAAPWLASYRGSFGADKILLVRSSVEGAGQAAWATRPGFVSAYYVGFLPIAHEIGHNMGGSHCNEGMAGAVNFGFPLSGYDASGVPVVGGPLMGGTHMCGNDVGFYSNPNITLTVEELEEYRVAGVVPDQDYTTILGPGGTLTMGDSQFANMAQVWTAEEDTAARRIPGVKPADDPCHVHDDPDCAGFYADPGYGELLFELCDGESFSADAQPAEVAAVRVGENVHVNLYTAPEFGAGTNFGGKLIRLAFSSPSLEDLTAHAGDPEGFPMVGSALVYDPDDRDSHFTHAADFAFFYDQNPPVVTVHDDEAETLRLLPDGALFDAAVALRADPIEPPFAVDFEYSSWTAGTEIGDGMVVMFGKDGSAYAGPPPRESLGFIADGTGVGVRFLTYPAGAIEVVDGNLNPVAAAVPNPLAYTDGAFVRVHLEVEADAVTVTYNDIEQLSVPITLDPTYGGVGIGVSTGAFTSEYLIRDFSITPR